MKTLFLATISLWLVSCGIATTNGNGTNGGNDSNDAEARMQLEDRWVEVMQQLDDACSDIDKCLVRQPAGDLKIVAARATESAKLISLGYGELDHSHVPGFAAMSRDCESWFLQIALEAKNGRRLLARDIYKQGRQQHCARCHDAHGAIK